MKPHVKNVVLEHRWKKDEIFLLAAIVQGWAGETVRAGIFQSVYAMNWTIGV
jgi:hypothetical protein